MQKHVKYHNIEICVKYFCIALKEKEDESARRTERSVWGMMEMLGRIASHAFEKLINILQTLCGWCALAAFFVMDYFAGHGFIVGLAVVVTLMDAAWGIAVSIKQGKFTLSELARLTIAKLAVYGCALTVFVGLDKVTDSVITGSLVGAAIVLVEFWSCCASMLIIYPHILFLRLLKKALTGEIASKLHIDESEVENVLKSEEARRKKSEVRSKKEEGRRTTDNRLIVVMCLMFLLSGCKTKTVVVTVPEVRTDTTYITKEQRDSIWLHDSIYVHEWSKNDTVYLELNKWHTKYVEKLRYDTIYQHKTDSVGVPYPVEVKVEKKLNWWQKTRMNVGTVALLLLLCWGVWKAAKWYVGWRK